MGEYKYSFIIDYRAGRVAKCDDEIYLRRLFLGMLQHSQPTTRRRSTQCPRTKRIAAGQENCGTRRGATREDNHSTRTHSIPESNEDHKLAGEQRLDERGKVHRVTVNQGAVSPCNARESNEVQPLRLG